MKFGCSIGIFLSSAHLICRSTDISKYFRGSLRLRDNESRLYFDNAGSIACSINNKCVVNLVLELTDLFPLILWFTVYPYDTRYYCIVCQCDSEKRQSSFPSVGCIVQRRLINVCEQQYQSQLAQLSGPFLCTTRKKHPFRGINQYLVPRLKKNFNAQH